jgi:hypothetical protein
VNHKRHGFGRELNLAGDLENQEYEGYFQFGMRSGQGVVIFGSGNRYQGEFSNDLMNGVGTYNFTDGSKWVGEWKNGEPQGEGEKIDPNGHTVKALFDNMQFEEIKEPLIDIDGTAVIVVDEYDTIDEGEDIK